MKNYVQIFPLPRLRIQGTSSALGRCSSEISYLVETN